MKIIVNNLEFPYNEGVRLLKLKNATCPFPQLAEIWDSIVPFTFREIAELPNLEQRRVGVMCLGLERLANEVKPELIDKKTLKKTTVWVNKDGETVTHKFDDTYELYMVKGEYFNKGIKSNYNKAQDCYYIKCKDTSTDREYFIWVDLKSVYGTNNPNDQYAYKFNLKKINAIACIAWTIQTNVPVGNIEKILRQGDCIMIKPKKMEGFLSEPRHLTEKEYKTLLVAES